MRVFQFTGTDPLTARIFRIQNGDSEDREKLIEEYIPFIVKTIAKKSNQYVRCESDEKFSIGLTAFNEAIDKYDAKKGGFISFASLVISSRITDYLRKSAKNPIASVELMAEQAVSDDHADAFYQKEEIESARIALAAFDLTFEKIASSSPKHADSRDACLKAAMAMYTNDQIKSTIYKQKSIPVSTVFKELSLSKKFIKRNCVFILSIIVILDSECDSLKNYILDLCKGGA